jgi:uncharacterized membrane protein YozB (DUF420 family)
MGGGQNRSTGSVHTFGWALAASPAAAPGIPYRRGIQHYFFVVMASLVAVLNTFDTVVFAILVGSAIYLRKQPEWHKRFLLSATLVLLGAPVLRLLILLEGQVSHTSLILDVLVVDLCFLICFASDLYTRRRIHPAYCCALALLVADQITTFSVISWAPWINFANAVQRFVS